MTDSSNPETVTNPSTPAQPTPLTPAQPTPQTPVQPTVPSGPSGPDVLRSLTDALNALPEKVAAAVREAAPKHPETSKTDKVVEAAVTKTTAPQKKSFAEWWGGS